MTLILPQIGLRSRGAPDLANIIGGYSYDSATASDGGTPTTLTVDTSSIGILAGDLVVGYLGLDSGTVPNTANSDFDTEISGLSGSGLRVFYTTAAGGETSFAFSGGSAMNHPIGSVVVIRGGSFITANVQDGGPSQPNPPSVSCAVDDLILAIGWTDDDIVTYTAQTGYTMVTAGSSGVSGSGCSTGSSVKIATSTTEDPGPFNNSGSDSTQAATIVIR